MFTGIITNQGVVLESPFTKNRAKEGGTLRLQTQHVWADLELGESISVNGVCLTLTSFKDSVLEFFVSPETLRVTTFNFLKPQDRVNLERALQPHARLSGHFVLGHVDGVATLSRVLPFEGGSYEIQVQLPQALYQYCFSKGSITLDGISLTINSLDASSSTVRLHIIPHTWENTHLSTLTEGKLVNIEADFLAKMISERISQTLQSLTFKDLTPKDLTFKDLDGKEGSNATLP